MKRAIISMFAVLSCCFLYAQEDTIVNNLQDFNYLTSYTEANYAAYPAVIRHGYGEEYQKLKDELLKHINDGSTGIKQATCEYAFWFNSRFDAHYYVDDHLFWHVYKLRDTPDYAHLMTYAPKAVSARVSKKSWLIRIPSCSGKNPSFDWVKDGFLPSSRAAAVDNSSLT